eukprot:3448639-Pleurochrysis_carterae.AAC.1
MRELEDESLRDRSGVTNVVGRRGARAALGRRAEFPSDSMGGCDMYSLERPIRIPLKGEVRARVARRQRDDTPLDTFAKRISLGSC